MLLTPVVYSNFHSKELVPVLIIGVERHVNPCGHFVSSPRKGEKK